MKQESWDCNLVSNTQQAEPNHRERIIWSVPLCLFTSGEPLYQAEPNHRERIIWSGPLCLFISGEPLYHVWYQVLYLTGWICRGDSIVATSQYLWPNWAGDAGSSWCCCQRSSTGNASSLGLTAMLEYQLGTKIESFPINNINYLILCKLFKLIYKYLSCFFKGSSCSGKTG